MALLQNRALNTHTHSARAHTAPQVLMPAGQRIEYKYVILEEQVIEQQRLV